MKNIFNSYSVRLLRDIKNGEEGFVLIDPTNRSEKGATLLAKSFFAIKTDLYFFERLDQARRYMSISYTKLFILGIKRVGLGLDERDFLLNFSYLDGEKFIGFNILNIDSKAYVNNPNYIYFSNININRKRISMDDFLDREEKYYSYEDDEHIYSDGFNDDDQYGYTLDYLGLKKYDLTILKEAMDNAISTDMFEEAVMLRDEIKKRKKIKL